MPLRTPLTVMRIRRQSPSNTFGMVRKRKDGTDKPHQGWDLKAAVGTPVYAVAEGEIIAVDTAGAGDYGKTITLRFLFDGQWYFAFYAHLSDISVTTGDIVHAGKEIGTSGRTGNAAHLKAAADEHLHFEIRTRWTGGKGLKGRIDPGQLLGYGVYSSGP